MNCADSVIVLMVLPPL